MSNIRMVVYSHETDLQVDFQTDFTPILSVIYIVFKGVKNQYCNLWGHNIYVKGLFHYLTVRVITAVVGRGGGWIIYSFVKRE